MKTAIIGHSGCGKSTLARYLGEQNHIPVLYLDSVYWMPGWNPRPGEEAVEIVKQFLDEQESWVIDGTYSKMEFERRMREADQIIFMDFNRFACLYRAVKRYFRYRGRTREDMGEGCQEKIDAEFVWWILHEGRRKKKKAHFQNILQQYGEKSIVIKNQKQLTEFMYREKR